jgi:hypothetical protein
VDILFALLYAVAFGACYIGFACWMEKRELNKFRAEQYSKRMHEAYVASLFVGKK